MVIPGPSHRRVKDTGMLNGSPVYLAFCALVRGRPSLLLGAIFALDHATPNLQPRCRLSPVESRGPDRRHRPRRVPAAVHWPLTRAVSRAERIGPKPTTSTAVGVARTWYRGTCHSGP
jgi:hypothetical protein